MQKSADQQWTIIDLVRWTTSYFQSHQIDSPRLNVELLLAHALGIERIDLYVRFDQPLTEEELADFKDLIKRRLRREPLAYILGRKDFWDKTFAVDQRALIPRPETEVLLEAALSRIPGEAAGGRKTVLELGTGSGAIVICLAAHRPGHLYYASDASLDALALARQNAGLHEAADRIYFFAGAWLEPVGGRIEADLIVSNPPYVVAGEIPGLAPEISTYEPAFALDGGADGLSAVKYILESAPSCMKPGARLLLEIGDGQAERVQGILDQNRRLDRACTIKDYAGRERVVEAVCRV
ncbi:MAG: peptide chain release factor N(5)-glutamine methyltransferase [Desulfosalsimonadaceae bacterium]